MQQSQRYLTAEFSITIAGRSADGTAPIEYGHAPLLELTALLNGIAHYLPVALAALSGKAADPSDEAYLSVRTIPVPDALRLLLHIHWDNGKNTKRPPESLVAPTVAALTASVDKSYVSEGVAPIDEDERQAIDKLHRHKERVNSP
jgi:hypothetical protein